MLNVIWTLKACMLFMFARMTTGTSHIKWIRAVAVYVTVGYIAAQITFFTACTPFSGYWAVPVSNPQCTTLVHYAIVQATFNLSSDVLIIAIPVPMILSLSLPTKQKIGLGLLFSMGTFVVRPPQQPMTSFINVLLDRRRNSYQSVQFIRHIRQLIHALVYAGSVSRGVCCQSAWHLAPVTRKYQLFARPRRLIYHGTVSHATLWPRLPVREYLEARAQLHTKPHTHECYKYRKR